MFTEGNNRPIDMGKAIRDAEAAERDWQLNRYGEYPLSRGINSFRGFPRPVVQPDSNVTKPIVESGSIPFNEAGQVIIDGEADHDSK